MRPIGNSEHLALLSQGVATWNQWRSHNLAIVPDLMGEILRGEGLIRADLFGANLRMADFVGADLSGANLMQVNLGAANLSGARLRGAELHMATLFHAQLNFADLSGTNFNSASFDGANFSEVELEDIIFSDVDLSEVKGLDSVTHHGQSSIGVDTIYKSQGNIPDLFLRDCGLDDTSIAYVRPLTATPIQFYS